MSRTLAEKLERLRLAARKGLTPPPRISVPEWADRYRILPKQEGGGKWSTARAEIARGPMLSVTEPGVHIITAMACTQILKTSLLINTFGYFAHLDPCPMLLVQPKDEAAESFSKERISPNIAATPVLRELIGSGRTRNSDETIKYKAFLGGFLAIVGAGSPTNLASRPIRVVLYDEIDKYEATSEGDPITIADERTAKFDTNWLSIRACSPTVEDESRIASSYAAGDQRRASVECPHCGHRQFLDFFSHVEWDKERDTAGNVTRHFPRTAQIFCESCGCGWNEGERLRALATIRWHQTRVFQCCGRDHSPLDAYSRAWRDDSTGDAVTPIWDWWEGDRWAVYRAKCPICGVWGMDNEHASFQASKLFSPWQKDKPSDIARKWIDAKDDEEKKQAWWNTQLGLPYRPRVGREVNPTALMERREVWPAEVPDGVAAITAGWDTQGDRLEVEIVGWGRGEESWSIRYEVLEGDPALPEVWERLDALLMRPLYRADGREFKIAATCGDSGGNHTTEVYSFCRARRLRRVWAIKGASETSGQRSPVWPSGKQTRRKSRDYKPVIIGTNAAKDRISSCLQIDAPGRGYMHFGADWDAGAFAQLTGERLVPKRRSGGRAYRIWEAKRNQAHERLDCRVYAYAALWGLIVEHRMDLDREADKVGAAADTAVVRADTPEGQRIAAQKGQMAEPPAAAKEKQKSSLRRSGRMTPARKS